MTPKHWGELPHDIKKKCIDSCAAVINSTERYFQPDLTAEAAANIILRYIDELSSQNNKSK